MWRVVSAEARCPGGEAPLVEPGRGPVAAVRGDQRLQVPTRLLRRGAGIGGEEAQRHGAEPELEQPAAARGLEVVVPLGGGPGDDRHLPLVQAEVVVQGRLRRRPRIGVREVDLRHARVDDRMPMGELRELRRALRGQHDRRVLFPQLQEPLMHPRAEERVHERHPRLIDQQERRAPVEPLLDPPKQIEQHREGDSVVQAEEVLHLEHPEAAVREVVRARV